MRAGFLRDRVRIEQPQRTEDASGAAATTWQNLGERDAQISVIKGVEQFGMATDAAAGDVRIRMRETPDFPAFDPSWRLTDVDRGDVFDVVAIVPSRARNDLFLICRRGGVRRSQ